MKYVIFTNLTFRVSKIAILTVLKLLNSKFRKILLYTNLPCQKGQKPFGICRTSGNTAKPSNFWPIPPPMTIWRKKFSLAPFRGQYSKIKKHETKLTFKTWSTHFSLPKNSYFLQKITWNPKQQNSITYQRLLSQSFVE